LVLRANAQEKAAHKKRLTDIAKTSNDFCVWTQMDMEN